jgi:hypothetical protein
MNQRFRRHNNKSAHFRSKIDYRFLSGMTKKSACSYVTKKSVGKFAEGLKPKLMKRLDFADGTKNESPVEGG